MADKVILFFFRKIFCGLKHLSRVSFISLVKTFDNEVDVSGAKYFSRSETVDVIFIENFAYQEKNFRPYDWS